MLQQEQPQDYVIATGVQHSVREFVDIAAAELGLRLQWQGSGVEEQGIIAAVDEQSGACRKRAAMQPQAKPLQPGDIIVQVDPRYFRPTEVETLLGDASRARTELGWQPRILFADLVKEMICADLEEAQRDDLCRTEGFKTLNHHE